MCNPLNVMCVCSEQMNSRVPEQYFSKTAWNFLYSSLGDKIAKKIIISWETIILFL